MKGLPLSYNRDMQEDKEPIFDSALTLRDSLEVTTGAVASLRVDVGRMREAATDPLLLATDLAEALVRAGAGELADLERSLEERSLRGGPARAGVERELERAEASIADALAGIESEERT
jgi:argininosuccinate lyase